MSNFKVGQKCVLKRVTPIDELFDLKIDDIFVVSNIHWPYIMLSATLLDKPDKIFILHSSQLAPVKQNNLFTDKEYEELLI